MIRFDFNRTARKSKLHTWTYPAGLRRSGVFLDPQINRKERCLQPWYRVPRALDRNAAYSSWKKHSERGMHHTIIHTHKCNQLKISQLQVLSVMITGEQCLSIWDDVFGRRSDDGAVPDGDDQETDGLGPEMLHG